MVTPNYGYEKRQKELAKKRKKEDKLKEKAQRKLGGLAGEDGAPEEGGDTPEADASGTGTTPQP